MSEFATIARPVTLSLVIPALNEQDGITSIMERVLSVQPALNQAGVDRLELIVVDDGSSDRTAEIVRTHPEVRLVQHAHNQGYGAALKSGFHHASGQLLGFPGRGWHLSPRTSAGAVPGSAGRRGCGGRFTALGGKQ